MNRRARQPRSTPPTGAHDDARRPVVLLLEDNDLDAELVAERLASDGFTFDVRRARDAHEYYELLQQGDAAIVLSDFSLPSYDGIAALEAAKQMAPGVPFLFVSGAIGEELAIDTMRRGATDYVLKNRLERLGPAVRRALKGAEDRRLRRLAEEERDRLLVSEQKAREAAEAANRMKDEFLALVSHELRTPLNAILGWASLLAAGEANAETATRGLRTIERNARVQARLIEDILDISRIVTGKLHLHPTAADVSAFVAAAVEACRPAAAAKEIELSVEIAPDVQRVVGDPDRLQQVVWNLVSNGVKFTPPRGSVRVRAVREDDEIVLRVADTGAGMDPSILPFIFERFRQGDASMTRAHGGLGLGLAIVRHLVEMHGGTVTAESPGRGEGATFTVRLPVRVPLAEAPDASRAPVSDAPGPNGGDDAPMIPGVLRGVRVLVVDDEPDTREIVMQVLVSSGAEVTTSASVLDALRKLSSFRPDVVVSDIAMPNVDGYSLLRRIRALDPAKGGAVPAIALTAYAAERDKSDAEAAGYQRHLAKPVRPSQLVSAVAEAIGRATTT